MNTKQLRNLFEENREIPNNQYSIDLYSNGGCSESCEVYPTE